MPRRILGLDRARASIAAKSCVAIIIGYALAVSFEWKASSVATTIVILQTSALGSTLHKAALRILGTLGGAVVGIALVALCSHNREVFFLAMAVMTGACVWAMQGSSYQYAWMLTVVTTAVVGWPAATDPLNTFQTTVDRVTVVLVGVILSSLAHGVFWPITAGNPFESAIRNLVIGCRDLLSLARQGVLQQHLDVVAIGKKESQLLSLATSLDGLLVTARQDSKRFRRYFDRYQQLSDELVELVLATGAIGDVAVLCTGETSTVVNTRPKTVDRAFDVADAAAVATIDQLSLARDGTARPRNGQPSLPDKVGGIEGIGSVEQWDDPMTDLLTNRIARFEKIAGRLVSILADLEDPRVGIPPARPASAPQPAAGVRLAKSALAGCQVLLAVSLFVVLNWPAGFQAGMLLVMVVAFLNAQLPIALPIRTFVKSVITALPLAAVFYFVVMPRTDGFTELAPWLAIMFFPFLYGVASRNPLTSVASMLTTFSPTR